MNQSHSITHYSMRGTVWAADLSSFILEWATFQTNDEEKTDSK